MSTINSIVALGVYAPGRRRSVAAAVAAKVQLYWEAVRDGSEALSRYNQLKARGVAHDAAVRQIFVEHFGTP